MPARALTPVAIVLLLVQQTVLGAIEPPKPGWNLFSPRQDIQLGKEAQTEVEKKMHVVHNSEINRYLTSLGNRLARSRYAGKWPYTFGLVEDPAVNAFSLPGGPIYVNSGLIASAADNEAQLAGVIAHEMSHIELRHATNQASKRNLIQIPAILAGLVGGGGMLGSLAEAGIGLGANSVLLKFSRSAESQADYNGALIMADAGYNPIEMARFFEKLEAQSGKSSALANFLSDHPNPGNRVRAVEDEIRQMPQREYTTNTGQFARIKELVAHLPGHGQLRNSFTDQHSPTTPDVRPSSEMVEYRGGSFSIQYPANWQVFGDQDSNSVTIAPRDAVFQNAAGHSQIGYGAELSYYFPPGDRTDLQRDTAALIQQLRQQNAGLREDSRREAQAAGEAAIVTTLIGSSPYAGDQELDALVTVARPQGLFYFIYISPKSEFAAARTTFDRMLGSLRFH